MLKIYTLINDFSLCTPIVVDGQEVSVVFGGGCKAMRQNGEFSTTDACMQEAIEKSPGFGRVYRLMKSFGGESPVAAVPEKMELKQMACATVNEAAEWLVGLGCRKSDVNTSVKAVAAAREQGYELIFKRGE